MEVKAIIDRLRARFFPRDDDITLIPIPEAAPREKIDLRGRTIVPVFDRAQQPRTEQKMSIDHEYWGNAAKNDFIGLFLGDKLGEGTARSVYEFIGQPGLVIKVETTAASFQNIAEWEAWQEVKDTHWGKWFAPCRRISPCGMVLIQERTMPLAVDTKGNEFPRDIPNFFTDLKPCNFGKIKGQFVCHDYALNHFRRQGLNSARMRKTKNSDWSWGFPDQD